MLIYSRCACKKVLHEYAYFVNHIGVGTFTKKTHNFNFHRRETSKFHPNKRTAVPVTIHSLRSACENTEVCPAIMRV
jgi:hypothetical protein